MAESLSLMSPTTLMSMVGSLLLVLVFGHLYARHKEPHVGYWYFAWVVHTLVFPFDFAYRVLDTSVLLIVALSLSVAASVLLASGVYLFLGRRPGWWMWWCGGLVILWNTLLPVLPMTLEVASAIPMMFVAVVNIATGIALWRESDVEGGWARFVGGVFFVWGTYRISFPALLAFSWFLEWAFLFSTAFEILVGFGILVVYYERARRSLAVADQRLRVFAERVPDVMYVLRLQPSIALEYVSSNVRAVTGYTARRLMSEPETVASLVDPALSTWKTELDSGADHIGPFVLQSRTASGGVVWAEHQVAVERDGAGKPVRIQGVARDVTARVLAEEALRESEQRYSTMFEENSSVMFVVDTESGHLIDANQAAAEFYGWSRDQLRTKWVGDLNVLPAAEVRKRLSLAAGERQRFEFQHRLADGSVRDVEVYTGPMSIGGKKCVLSIVHDISERRSAERELQRYKERLEDVVAERTRELTAAMEALETATRAKDDFMASMSHELRTPLNSVIGFSSILLQELAGPLTDEQKRQLDMVQHAGKHLLEIVNDILDLSRIEVGGVDVLNESVDVLGLVRDVAEAVRPLCTERGLALELEFPEGSVVVRTDPRHAEQILWNLMGNAVKFTEEGSITVRVIERDHEVAVEVQDTGCGLDAETQVLIFEQFVQVRIAGRTRPEGTGLGLAISLRLAELLGGTIEVESTVGDGSLFRLTLPLVR